MLFGILLPDPSVWQTFCKTSCQWMKNKQALHCTMCIKSFSSIKGMLDLIISGWGLAAGRWLQLCPVFVSTSITHCLPIESLGSNKTLSTLYFISINYLFIIYTADYLQYIFFVLDQLLLLLFATFPTTQLVCACRRDKLTLILVWIRVFLLGLVLPPSRHFWLSQLASGDRSQKCWWHPTIPRVTTKNNQV